MEIIMGIALTALLLSVLALGLVIYWMQTVSGNHTSFLPTAFVPEGKAKKGKDGGPKLNATPEDVLRTMLELCSDGAITNKNGFYTLKIMPVIAKTNSKLLKQCIEASNASVVPFYNTFASRLSLKQLTAIFSSGVSPTDSLKILITTGLAFRQLPIPAKFFLFDSSALVSIMQLTIDARCVVVSDIEYADALIEADVVVSINSWNFRKLATNELDSLVEDIKMLTSETYNFDGVGEYPRPWPLVREFGGEVDWFNKVVKSPVTLKYIQEIFTAISFVENIGIPSSYVKINPVTMAMIAVIDRYIYTSKVPRNENDSL
jgi:hypothetical protein